MSQFAFRSRRHLSGLPLAGWRPARRIIRAGALALAVSAVAITPAWADQPITYTVQAGDTLFAIAQQFQVPPERIATANGLPDPNRLSIGQTLRIWLTGAAPPSPSGDSSAHYPAFAITPDGIVVRALSTTPPAPPILSAPYRSQFDGSIWAESNCGPTALSMALGALGIDVDQLRLRQLANDQMGMADPNNGTTWESLAYAAQASGARVSGLYQGQSYRRWTIENLKAELSQGHPVLLLVRYWDLPDHLGSGFAGDHYVVALGVDGNGNVVYNDSAFRGDGSDRVISPAALQRAWTNTSVGLVRTAMALYK